MMKKNKFMNNKLLSLSFLMSLSVAQGENPSIPSSTPSHLSTFLTLYKNGSLVKSIYKFPLTLGRSKDNILGIAKTIRPKSLMISLKDSAQKARILESTLLDSPDETYTLELLCDSKINKSDENLELTYIFQGMTWEASYAFELSSDETKLRLTGDIEILNNSDISFNQAKINFIENSLPDQNKTTDLLNQGHTYTFPCEVTLCKKSSKRLNWVATPQLDIKTEHRVFVGGEFLADMKGKVSKPVVERWLYIQNTKENSLGYALPAGNATLYVQNEKGELNVLGHIQLPHVSEGEEMSVKLPEYINQTSQLNPCVAVETTLEQSHFRKLSDNHVTEANYRFIARNANKQTVTIKVIVNTSSNIEWSIVRSTHPHKENKMKQPYWILTIPAGGEIELKYQINVVRMSN